MCLYILSVCCCLLPLWVWRGINRGGGMYDVHVCMGTGIYGGRVIPYIVYNVYSGRMMYEL